MQKAHDSSYNTYWRNYPNISTPIVQDQLNRQETTVDTIDDRVVAFDTTKANQTDLLLDINNVTFDSTTGTFTYTRQNGTTIVIDTDIEKIAINFDYDDDPTSAHYQNLIITLDDGTVKYVDMSALVTQYEFTDSSCIHFTITNGVISADVINGSITADKLQPNFLADCTAQATAAATSALTSEAWAVGQKNGVDVPSTDVQYENNSKYYSELSQTSNLDSEAWARGTKNNVPVTPTDAQYHDNSYYWAQQARAIVGDKVDSFNGRIGTVVAEDGDYESGMLVPTSAQVGQVPVVRNVGTGQNVKLRYVNEDYQSGILPHIIITSDTGSTVTLTKGTTVIYASETSTGRFESDVTEFGTWTIVSVLSGDDAQASLTVDTVTIYTVDVSHFSAEITVTYPAGATCSCTKSGESPTYASTNPYTFVVHSTGTYTITATDGTATATDTVTITTSGQTESVTLSFVPEGSTALPTDDVQILLHCAEIWDKSYTTISELLADSTSLSTVVASNNAIDYLVRSTTFASNVTADSTAMSYIGLNNYASNTLIDDSTWLTAIAESAYIESIMNVKVPTMTSATAPSGQVFASTEYSVNYAWKAFDNNDTTYWNPTQQSVNNYIGYTFTSAKTIKCARISVNCDLGSSGTERIFTIQATSNNTWSADLGTLTIPKSTANLTYNVALQNDTAFTSYRFFCADKLYVGGNYMVQTFTIQFYGRENV